MLTVLVEIYLIVQGINSISTWQKYQKFHRFFRNIFFFVPVEMFKVIWLQGYNRIYDE